MANGRFEMHEIRQGIVQMRPGLTEGQIAKAGLMGRRKTSGLRRIASELVWLDKESLLHDNMPRPPLYWVKDLFGRSPCVDPASEGSGHPLVVRRDQGDHHIPGPGEAPRIRGEATAV